MLNEVQASLPSYPLLRASYLKSGLTQTIVHMRERFRLLITDDSRRPTAEELFIDDSRSPTAEELSCVLIDYQLNEIEFALMFYYYEKTNRNLVSVERFELLLLAGFHAKNYFNEGMEMYKELMNERYPWFYMRYRAFANGHCSQDVSPTALNDAFCRLRSSPEAHCHLSYDLNYQTDQLAYSSQPSLPGSEAQWEEIREAPCYQLQHTLHFLMFEETEVQVDTDLGAASSPSNTSTPSEPPPTLGSQSSINEEWASPTDGFTFSRANSMEITDGGTFSRANSMEMKRQNSFFSSLKDS